MGELISPPLLVAEVFYHHLDFCLYQKMPTYLRQDLVACPNRPLAASPPPKNFLSCGHPLALQPELVAKVDLQQVNLSSFCLVDLADLSAAVPLSSFSLFLAFLL